ncbi:hypothetical protein HJG60_008948 [Phyllostomus discolor]|uniref:Uncharacterized protein n=1 Tax=Phyllostomus discolor TaxID=89673 RepID=A0A833YSW5_9CHIR|nr:hypothetical protein HJG60_008948 [Phyllostomus discolor]
MPSVPGSLSPLISKAGLIPCAVACWSLRSERSGGAPFPEAKCMIGPISCICGTCPGLFTQRGEGALLGSSFLRSEPSEDPCSEHMSLTPRPCSGGCRSLPCPSWAQRPAGPALSDSTLAASVSCCSVSLVTTTWTSVAVRGRSHSAPGVCLH